LVHPAKDACEYSLSLVVLSSLNLYANEDGVELKQTLTNTV